MSMLHLFSFVILEYPNNQRGAKGSEIRFLYTGKLFHLANCALLKGPRVCVVRVEAKTSIFPEVYRFLSQV